MTTRGELQIYASPPEVAQALADLFVTAGSVAVAERGAFRVALSGGNTPRAAYELLAREPLRLRLDWSRVYVYFGDERCVPPTDERSNYRMADLAFLRATGIPEANVYRMHGEADPGIAANEYASLLRADLGALPHLDLVLLGLGEDGHTASLFPGALPEGDDGALVRAVYADSQKEWRITLTPAVINAAACVAFAVEGAQKAPALAAVYEGADDPAAYPAQIVAPASGRLVWIVDEAAAGLLHV